jgi:PhnB protein
MTNLNARKLKGFFKSKTSYMKEVVKVPPGYQTLMPYLILKDASGFLQFTEKVFDATIIRREMRDPTTVLHAEVNIAECIIMFADATENYPPKPGSFFLYVANADETYQKALDAGGKALTVMADQQYGRSGGVEDPFGNSWWITMAK